MSARAHPLANLTSAAAYAAAHAGLLPCPIYWPLTGAWSWASGSPGGLSMRFFGLVAWAASVYALTYAAAALSPRLRAAPASTTLSRAALATTCAAMLYVLAAEVAAPH